MATPTRPHDYVGDRSSAKPPGPNYPWLAVQAVASLRVTMVLFGLALFLVFFGTLAQKHAGIERVLTQYFYCWIATVDLNLISDFTEIFFQFRFFGTLEQPVRLPVPFPGGYLIGWAMALNLTAAHVVRFKLTWRRAGIWILHAGMVVLLGGEFIRAEMGYEDRLMIVEGESSNKLFDINRVELVVSKPAADGRAETVAVPGELLAAAAPTTRRPEPGRVDLPGLPFHARVKRYMANSDDLEPRSAADEPQGTAGIGRAVGAKEKPEVAGTDPDARVNAPAAVVEFVANDTGDSLGVYVVRVDMTGRQVIPAAAGPHRVILRRKQTVLPFTLTAEKIEHDVYPGTETPRNYASTIRLVDTRPESPEDRTVKIWMNNPLRYDERTFYQSGMDTVRGAGLTPTKLTILQVVRNPGWRWPYVSCTLVGVGMLIHFGMKFTEFLKKKAAADRRAKGI